VGRPARLFARPRLSSLRTTFAVTFALVTAAVTVVVGILSYDSAARLVRVDQQSVFTQVVQDVRNEVRRYDRHPVDFSSTSPGHEVVRPARTDVQVLGAQGQITDHGSPVLPVTSRDRAMATARTAGKVAEHKDVRVGDDLFRIATASLGHGRGAV